MAPSIVTRLAVGSTLCWTAVGAGPALTDPPKLTSFEVDNGAFNTADRTVGLHFRFDGTTPTMYRAGEKSDLSGVAWHAIGTTGTPSLTLSATLGFKTVYFQLGAPAPLPPRAGDASRTGTITPTILVPGVVSNILSDTIVLGLPDLRMEVRLPASVKDGRGRQFAFDVTVSNAGQATPPGQVITLYNSFVLNQIAMENVMVDFGASRLVGRGCQVTEVPTIECTLAPIPPGGGVGFHFTATVNNLLTTGQTSASPTLRSRIFGVRESNIANNWVDTPLLVVR